MNILIPAAGTGRRFVEDGYTLPKPLIPALGEPMISHVIRNLQLGTEDRVYVVYTQDLERYQFRSILRKAFYDLDLNFIPLNFHTRGPAETVLCGLNKIPDISPGVLVLDCDTFYREDVVALAKEQGNCIFYFDDPSLEPIFSYIQIDARSRVTEIQEKVRISSHACAGAYAFRSGQLLKEYCEQVLDADLRSHREYYLSNVYDQMLQRGETVRAVQLQDFVCLGTPQQLKIFCSSAQGAAPLRFCFDLDGTLVTFPEIPGDYKTVRPILRNIRFLQHLHEQGHTIILQTARKMLTSRHNAGLATRTAYADVFATLERYEIPFDEIYFGKPHAHFYIDDLSVQPYDCERATGFYDTHVEARPFHRIEYRGDQVIKTTSNLGEVYWYQHVPESMRDHFPQAQVSGSCLTLERIQGIVFSYLLINNSLTRANVGNLLETVERLHASAPVPDSQIDYTANYTPKMAERFRAFDYRTVSHEAECTFREIEKRLSGHAPVVGVIHGDLVFSNIFLCDHGRIRFIDMRGRVGETLTLFGDIFYDYAKIYQSLLGYDFILKDCEINESYLAGLRQYFEERFEPVGALPILRSITACLLFSLIPLHKDLKKQQQYFQLIERCL